jgi:L-asparaginase II
MSNPVLVEITRGRSVESRHRGAFAVVDDGGRVALSAGDPQAGIFPRSAIKALQALSLVMTGAADAAGFDDADLALACSSHSGDTMHVARAGEMLRKLGCDENALVCAPHWSIDPQVARALAASGGEPCRLHNNCSGKHAGFLALARQLGASLTGYESATHPAQRLVIATLEQVCATQVDIANGGRDGCGIPAPLLPLQALAFGFARFGSGSGLDPQVAAAAARLHAATAAHPEMVAGGERLDTRVMREHGARVYVKIGAEGVYCGAIPGLGLGIAVKIDDGAARAAEAVMVALLARLLDVPATGSLAIPAVTNWSGETVGAIRVDLPKD